MSARAELAGGLLLTDYPWPDRATVIAQATDELRRRLNPTTVWQSGYLPPELRGRIAYGEEVVRWSSRDDVTPDEAHLLETAWSAALPPLDRGMRDYLRVRVDSPQDVRRLRAIGEVDGLMIVPSLDSRRDAPTLVAMAVPGGRRRRATCRRVVGLGEAHRTLREGVRRRAV